MTKLFLTIGLLSALSGSAFAQSTYDGAATADYDRGAMQSDDMQSDTSQFGITTSQPGKFVDTTTTGSISSSNSQDEATQLRRGEQGNVFGANGN